MGYPPITKPEVKLGIFFARQQTDNVFKHALPPTIYNHSYKIIQGVMSFCTILVKIVFF